MYFLFSRVTAVGAVDSVYNALALYKSCGQPGAWRKVVHKAALSTSPMPAVELTHREKGNLSCAGVNNLIICYSRLIPFLFLIESSPSIRIS